MRPLLICTLMIFLAGCQALPPRWSLPAGDDRATCRFDDAQLAEWLRVEHRYVSSTLDGKRQLLVDAERRQQTVLHALLLSTPGQSPEQLRRAHEVLSQYRTAPAHCSYSRYLDLRLRQLQRQLELLDQRQTLQQQVEELQRQVDALTDLERQITRQREEH